MQNVAEMEAMALWQMRPCWGADAAAAAPPRLVDSGGVRGVCVSTGDPGVSEKGCAGTLTRACANALPSGHFFFPKSLCDGL